MIIAFLHFKCSKVEATIVNYDGAQTSVIKN